MRGIIRRPRLAAKRGRVSVATDANTRSTQANTAGGRGIRLAARVTGASARRGLEDGPAAIGTGHRLNLLLHR